MKTSPTPDTRELRKISDLPVEMSLRRAAQFVEELVEDPAFVETTIHPVLVEARAAKDWYVARRIDGEDGACSLQVFVWPRGTKTKVHDHASWGIFRCAVGSVLEERFERLDDGSRPDHARLKNAWKLSWSPEDGASTVLPGDGGIHRVTNPSEGTAISVHVYGPRMGGVEGRDYDPSRDHVCDRPERD